MSFKHLKMVVFDEADRMLSMGFYPDMKEMQRHFPDRRLHSCMFSATFPDFVMRTAREFLNEPEFLSLSRDHVHVTDTEHVYYIVPGMDKDRSLIKRANKVNRVSKASSRINKITAKVSYNLEMNKVDSKPTKQELIKMETTKTAKTNSNKVRPRITTRVSKVLSPTNSRINSWRTKTRTVKTTMMVTGFLMI